jgi:uncharacterized protein YuzB (UPF0349 family)
MVIVCLNNLAQTAINIIDRNNARAKLDGENNFNSLPIPVVLYCNTNAEELVVGKIM